MRTRLLARVRRDDELDVRQAAVRGATAGLAGGGAVLLLSWLARRGVVAVEETPDDEWERLVRNVARRAGVKLTARQLHFARVTAQLTYFTLLGAAYGMARNRGTLPGPLRAALNGGLVHAASLPMVAQATPTRRRPRRKQRSAANGRLAIPIGSAALFGLTTSAAFTALERA
jgi:hypothetical protein